MAQPSRSFPSPVAGVASYYLPTHFIDVARQLSGLCTSDVVLTSSLGNRVRAQYVNFIAPRDHGNTDGVDPDSCNDVHVSDVLIDVGDDVRTSSARFQYECGMLDSVEPGDGVQSRWWWCSAESTPLTPLPEVGGWGEGRGALCFPFYATVR